MAPIDEEKTENRIDQTASSAMQDHTAFLTINVLANARQ
jgi:hypothetical protein